MTLSIYKISAQKPKTSLVVRFQYIECRMHFVSCSVSAKETCRFEIQMVSQVSVWQSPTLGWNSVQPVPDRVEKPISLHTVNKPKENFGLADPLYVIG